MYAMCILIHACTHMAYDVNFKISIIKNSTVSVADRVMGRNTGEPRYHPPRFIQWSQKSIYVSITDYSSLRVTFHVLNIFYFTYLNVFS